MPRSAARGALEPVLGNLELSDVYEAGGAAATGAGGGGGAGAGAGSIRVSGTGAGAGGAAAITGAAVVTEISLRSMSSPAVFLAAATILCGPSPAGVAATTVLPRGMLPRSV